MKRLVILIILVSMGLHCSSRIGLLSYLYEHRHEIAFTVGLIAEMPIAICSSDHSFDSGLKIQAQDEADGSIPRAVFQTQDIQLFFSEDRLTFKSCLDLIRENEYPNVTERVYRSPIISIFHPPSIIS